MNRREMSGNVEEEVRPTDDANLRWRCGVAEVVEYLLKVRGDEEGAINTANKDGRTCLHIAALTNNLWLAKFLLDRHADVNAVMRNKVMTSLMKLPPVAQGSGAGWEEKGGLFVCCLVGCLTSQQHASVSQGRICSDNFTCCHTEKEVADQTFHLTQSQYTDTGPTSPSADPITPGAWQGSHWSANF